MRKLGPTRALYAGSFDPITRGHLDVIDKALKTFDHVHVAIGVNVKKKRSFDVDQSLRLMRLSIIDLWPEARTGQECAGSEAQLFDGALSLGEFTDQSLMSYARTVGATHIVRGLRETRDFNEEFELHGVAGRLDPSIPMVHFMCDPRLLHVSSSTARELGMIGEKIAWLVTPSVETAFAARRAAGSSGE